MRGRFPAGFVAVVGLWLVLGAVLAQATSRVSDWFVMTDELLYERLAISIAKTHSVLPQIHRQTISSIDQLYPLVIAPTFRHGAILHGFHETHTLNAFVMTSAALPAYLLARRVTHHTLLSLFVAVATASVPWIVLSSFMLTEVAAYPAFLWAVLALQYAIERPSVHGDVLAVLGIALGVFARTQFYVLAPVLVAAIVAIGVVERQVRRQLRAHVTLAVVLGLGAVAAIGLYATGHSPLGTYATTTTGNPFPSAIIGFVPAHLALVAIGGGVLPAVIGGAWLASNLHRSESRERLAYAWLAVLAVVVLTVEVASFDLRFGGGIVRDRYLFYVTPLLLVALAAALSAERRPRLSLAIPVAILAVGVWRVPLVTFQKLNADTPVSTLNDWLLSTMRGVDGAKVFLVLAIVVVAVAFLEAALLAPRAAVALGACVLLLVALPLESAYAFKRLFAVNGTSSLPMTLDQSSVFGWVDREITTGSEAVMVPYPMLGADYFSDIAFWWDLEFWNKSVDREAAPPNQFSGTPPGSFPKIDPRFDPHTGKANFDVDSYVAQAVNDARFHIEGKFFTTQRGVSIVFPVRPWRADWVSYGLYPDGWTRPATTARVRVFANDAQRTPVLRTLTLTLVAPVPQRTVVVSSNTGSQTVSVTQATTNTVVTVCVPRHAPADVTLRALGSSPIGGDPTTIQQVSVPRNGGVLVNGVSLEPTLGATCRPSR